MEQASSTKHLVDPTDEPLMVKDSTFFLSLAVVGFALAAVTTLGNCALLLTIFRDTRRLLQTPPSLLIANLCVSDLVVGLISGNLVAVKDVYRFQHLSVLANWIQSFNWFLACLCSSAAEQ